jgi:hypothetical protein
MNTAEPTLNPATVTIADWRELASRTGDGLEISLLWSPSNDSVKVTVLDGRLGESFDLHVLGADALSAYKHPFAYAAGRGLGFGDLMSESLDLQTQN